MGDLDSAALELAPASLRDRIATAAREGGQWMLSSIATVVKTALTTLLTGVGLAWALFIVCWAIGWLDAVPWYGQSALWLVTIVAATGLMWWAALVRASGRLMIDVGLERGLVTMMVNRVIYELASLMGVGDLDQRMARLPLKRWESHLKQAVGAVASDDVLASKGRAGRLATKILDSVRRRLHGYIEAAMLTSLRDLDDGEGISVAHLSEKIFERVERLFRETIESHIRSTMTTALALVVAVAVLPSLAIGLLI